jgi:hypothetical protein
MINCANVVELRAIGEHLYKARCKIKNKVSNIKVNDFCSAINPKSVTSLSPDKVFYALFVLLNEFF